MGSMHVHVRLLSPAWTIMVFQDSRPRNSYAKNTANQVKKHAFREFRQTRESSVRAQQHPRIPARKLTRSCPGASWGQSRVRTPSRSACVSCARHRRIPGSILGAKCGTGGGRVRRVRRVTFTTFLGFCFLCGVCVFDSPDSPDSPPLLSPPSP